MLRLVSVLILVSSVTSAQERQRPPVEHTDLWSEPYPGIRYLRRVTTAPCTVHVLEIDLSAEGVEVFASTHDERWHTVGDFARDNDVVAAINGGFWESMAQPGGLQVTGGERWPGTKDDPRYGVFSVRRNGRVRIHRPEDITEPYPEDTLHAVSGRPMLVDDGELDVASIDPSESANLRQPRTVAGLARHGRRLWLAVTDGRQEHSKGMTLYEAGRLLIELGAERALNLDGGGSSTLFIERLGGIVNAPSGGRWEQRLGLGATSRQRGEETGRVRRRNGRELVYVRGVEREVMNSLGIRAPGPAIDVPLTPPPLSMPGEDREVVVLPPRPPTVSLGKLREWVVPVGVGGGLLVVLLVVRRCMTRRPKLKGRVSQMNDVHSS